MNGMGSEEGDISSTPPGIETTEDSAEAAKSSADSTELPRPRRGSVRRVARAVTSVDCGSVAEAPARVLRARGAGAGWVSDAKTAACKNKPTSLHSGRGTPARSRSKNIPVMRPEMKKSTAKTASKHTLGTAASPKLSSRSRKGNGGPLTQTPCTTPAAACKPEAEMEASTCGEEIDYSKGRNEGVADSVGLLDEDTSVRDGSNDLNGQPETKTGTPKQHAMLQHKEVKEEESEKEEEDIGIKSKASRVGPGEDGVCESSEPPRKRGRQQKDDKVPRLPKRRKKPPVQYVRCEMEGCGTVLAHPRYLQHHIKYQHLLKKKYVCDHPSCGRLFRLQKQLLRHAKHHTDQRDYICEYCARAFKSSHNLAVHRMIHTGEKPIQCEICGFTCRQKASLNWHMKKHDAEASYQFSCSICSKRFEKKDSVVAHKAKSHPEVLIAEALASNGGSVISSPTPITETVPVLTQPDQPTVSPENQEAVTGTLAAVQQEVHLVSPQMQIYASPGQFLQLPVHHAVRGEHQQQAPNLLHVSSAPHAQLTNIGHPQLIQLSTIPTSNVSPLSTADPQSTLLTLSTVTTLASTASLGSQQAVQWGKETQEDTQLSGEGELWHRVVVGDVRPDVGEMMWEGNGGRRKEDEGIEWERDGERDILLQSAEDQGDHLM